MSVPAEARETGSVGGLSGMFPFSVARLRSFNQSTILRDPPLILSLPETKLEAINVVVTFESVDETLVYDHSNESY